MQSKLSNTVIEAIISLDAYFYRRESKLRQVLVEGALCTHFRRQAPPQTDNRNILLPQATALCLG